MITIVRHPGGQLQIDGTWVPDDMANADRREIARLLAADPPEAEIVDAPAPPAPSLDERVSARINAGVSLAAFAEIIDELAGVVSVAQAPKLHAMKDRLAAIRAQETR